MLGLGGVACTDGGAGLVTALGGRLLDASGTVLGPGGAALARLDHIDASRFGDLSGAGTEIIAATDVDNPLLGPRGAAAVYAPQKGASAQDVTVLEEGLARWADVTERSFGFAKRDEPGGVRRSSAPSPVTTRRAPDSRPVNASRSSSSSMPGCTAAPRNPVPRNPGRPPRPRRARPA